MKKPLFCALLLLLGLCAFGQEYRAGLGLGPEFNMNARENFAGGATLGLDFNLPKTLFALGLTATASYNFEGFITMEPMAMFRWYSPGGSTGFFVQADAGAFLILEQGEFISPMALGGIRAGFRLPLGERMYLEPYGRAGYPFMFGIGLVGGVRLGSPMGEPFFPILRR
jgi:hypothetical protein